MGDLDTRISREGLTRVLFQLENLCDQHAGSRQAEALFKHLAINRAQDQALERIAVVGRRVWERWATGALRPVVGANVRYFEPSRFEKALAWLHD